MCSSSRHGAASEQMFHPRAGHGVQSALSQQRVNNRRSPAAGPGGVLTLRYRSVPLFNLPRGEKDAAGQQLLLCSLQREPEPSAQSQVTPGKTKPSQTQTACPAMHNDFLPECFERECFWIFPWIYRSSKPKSPYKALLPTNQRRKVTKYKYFTSVLDWVFHISELYMNISYHSSLWEKHVCYFFKSL